MVLGYVLGVFFTDSSGHPVCVLLQKKLKVPGLKNRNREDVESAKYLGGQTEIKCEQIM
jgi:hypothetical protein